MNHLARILLVLALNHGAAALDAWSTRRLVQYGGGYEANPLERPFVHSRALYLTNQPDAFLADYLLLKHSRTKTRKIVLDGAGLGFTAAHLGSAFHNLAIKDELPALSPVQSNPLHIPGSVNAVGGAPHIFKEIKGAIR